MFKKFVKEIARSYNKEIALHTVFYGKDGIDAAYQQGKISFEDHEILLTLIEKMA